MQVLSAANGPANVAVSTLLTALQNNAQTTLPDLSAALGSFSLTGFELCNALAPLYALDCVSQQASLRFTLAFDTLQNAKAVQSSIQTAVASANAPVLVTSSAVNVSLTVYNVTAVFPPDNQVRNRILFSLCVSGVFSMACFQASIHFNLWLVALAILQA